MNMRQPAVAGQFYPGDRKGLQRMVEEYISQSKVEAAPERVVAIIAPHAGYIYSGPTAGYAYARIRGKQPKRVILLGCSHRCGISGASVFDTGGFAIPLGSFPIDEPFAKALAARTESVSMQPHLYEHALEVHLPFLWVTLGSPPIVPVLFGGPADPWHVTVGQALAEMVDESDLVIASTDLSHYLSDKRAQQIDRRTIDTVLSQNCAALIDGLMQDTCSMCGGSAVVAAMAFASARGAQAWSTLDYRTSGATSGDYDRVVGYVSISMERAA